MLAREEPWRRRYRLYTDGRRWRVKMRMFRWLSCWVWAQSYDGGGGVIEFATHDEAVRAICDWVNRGSWCREA